VQALQKLLQQKIQNGGTDAQIRNNTESFYLARLLSCSWIDDLRTNRRQCSDPPHPRSLRYTALQYTPPQASAYRQALRNGAVGFFAEDHDLPLVNISLLVRAEPISIREQRGTGSGNRTAAPFGGDSASQGGCF